MRLSLNLVGRLALLSMVAVCVSGQQKAERCDPSYCRLPDCYCGGTDIPGGYEPQDIPQFVLLTFDDAVNDLNEKFFGELFKERLNPNGCPIKVIDCFKRELDSSKITGLITIGTNIKFLPCLSYFKHSHRTFSAKCPDLFLYA